ncbi:MAG: VWA domain-containing protein [Candidatus Pacearchaeota archaeon]
MNFSFTRPDYLFLLFMIPLLIFIHFLSLNVKKTKALKFANFEAIARIKGIDLYSKNIFTLVFSCIILFLLIMSASGLTLHLKTESSGFAFVLAIDSSRSMEAEDLQPNRLEFSKNIAKNFVKKTKIGTKIAIISFSGISRIEKKFSQDKEELINAIDNIQFKEIGGTDLSEVIFAAIKLFSNENKKAIILLSDGQFNVGDLDEAIEKAKSEDIVINTIGIGTKEGGKTSYGLSKLDEDSLKALAYNTDGKFFMFENSKDLEKYFEEIMDLRIMEVSIPLSNYLLISCIVLFFIEFIVINIRYKFI